MELIAPELSGNGAQSSTGSAHDLPDLRHNAIIALEADGAIASWNAAAGHLFSLGDRRTIGSHIRGARLNLGMVGLDRLLEQVVRRAPRPQVDRGSAAAEIALSIAIFPVHDSGGRMTGASLVTTDVTEQLYSQQHQALALREANHRVKNTLAVVQAIARLMFKDASDPHSSSAQFLDRLGALARTQDLLDPKSWREVSLREIAAEQAAPYLGSSRRCTLDGPAFLLRPGAAVALGMIFHELATNSAKYGAFSVPEGRVELAWTIEPGKTGRRLTLFWREFGGPPVEPPQRRGLGSRMLEHGLANELRGRAELQFDRTGVIYTLAAPLASVEAA